MAMCITVGDAEYAALCRRHGELIHAKYAREPVGSTDDLAETLRDIDGQISSAQDEIWRLQAWRAEVVAQMEQVRAEQPDAADEQESGE